MDFMKITVIQWQPRIMFYMKFSKVLDHDIPQIFVKTGDSSQANKKVACT